MATKTPVKATFSGSNVTGLAEYTTGDFIGLSHGGIGASLSIGTAGQVLKVNSGASALEFGSVSATLDIDTANDLTGSTLATTDLLLASDGGTEGKIALSQLDTLFSGTSKTLTNKTLTSAVLNTGVSGTAVLDEDNMASDSATKVATQQSIKAYVDNSIDTEMDVVFAADSSSGQITLDSETMTIAGGDNITTAASGNTITINLSNDVVTLTGTQTLSNKTFTSPTINVHTFSSGTTHAGMSIGANGIVFEGATADAHETTLTAVDPTQDNTITIPDATMTAITTATHATKAVHIARAIALG